MFNSIQEFVDFMNQNHKDAGTLKDYSKWSIEPGRKYTRIAVERAGQKSVYCFVDADLNVFKAAGWKAPAKGIRANLRTVDRSKIDWNTGWLYR